MEAKQKESFIHYFKSAGRHSAASWEAWPQHTQQWLGKTNTTTMNILPFSSIPWASTAEHIVIWSGVSLWSVHAGCPSCVPSQAHALFPPVHWDGMGWCRAEWAQEEVLLMRKPSCYCPQQQQEHQWVINSVPAKDSTVWTAVPARPIQQLNMDLQHWSVEKVFYFGTLLKKKATKPNQRKNQTPQAPFSKEWTAAG